MDFDQIPVGALTHLYFSFAYITPGEYNIAPMDDLDRDLFDKFNAVKRKNSGLKTVVALGGWTFNDPGPTQKVFSDMVSTATNRATFIENLFSFMRQYAFDGVDFDWVSICIVHIRIRDIHTDSIYRNTLVQMIVGDSQMMEQILLPS